MIVKNSLGFEWEKHNLPVPESFILVDVVDGIGRCPQLGKYNHKTCVYVKNCSPDNKRRLQFNFRDCRFYFVTEWPQNLEEEFAELEQVFAAAWNDFVASGEHDKQLRDADTSFMQARAAARATWFAESDNSAPSDGMRRM